MNTSLLTLNFWTQQRRGASVRKLSLHQLNCLQLSTDNLQQHNEHRTEYVTQQKDKKTAIQC